MQSFRSGCKYYEYEEKSLGLGSQTSQLFALLTLNEVDHFIKEESLSTESYLDYFYPFDKMDFHKKGVESSWSVSDKDGIAIALATGKF